MHRFHLIPELAKGSVLVLPETEAHHAASVLRLRPGERVAVMDGAGGELRCEAQGVDRKRVELKVTQRITHPAPACQITLVQSVLKGKAMDLVIQKATELGARRIVPLLAERSVSQVEEEDAAAKAAKWTATAIESIKQCGSPWLPVIEAPVTLPAFLARKNAAEFSMIASLQPGAMHPRDCIRNFQIENRRPPAAAQAWIGPEGDFTPEEVQSIRDSGAWAVTLGRLVLRAETAAICCLSILNYEFQPK